MSKIFEEIFDTLNYLYRQLENDKKLFNIPNDIVNDRYLSLDKVKEMFNNNIKDLNELELILYYYDNFHENFDLGFLTHTINQILEKILNEFLKPLNCKVIYDKELFAIEWESLFILRNSQFESVGYIKPPKIETLTVNSITSTYQNKEEISQLIIDIDKAIKERRLNYGKSSN